MDVELHQAPLWRPHQRARIPMGAQLVLRGRDNMPNHPNATASLWTTGLAAIILQVAHHYDWFNLSAETSLLAAGGIITAVLFVGRRGIWPTLTALWRGSQTAVVGKPVAPVKADTPV